MASRAIEALLHDGCAHILFKQGDERYTESLKSYWCNQATEVTPAAIVRPQSVSDVCSVVRTLGRVNVATEFSAKFAIRSGGHQSWGNAANIHSGITIDLRSLDRIDIQKEMQQVVVGVGCHWSDVYERVEAEGLMVPGARVTNCGVAGLSLGGGLSYFSPRLGLVCDNMINIEIVLADGAITQANASSNRDLFKALKGGSNNFGVVTRITLRTIPWTGNMWGGTVIYSFDHTPKQLENFCNAVADDDSYDVNAAMIIAVGFHHQFADMCPMGYNSLKYTKPIIDPPFLKPFTEMPKFKNSMRTARLKELLDEEGATQGSGHRRLFMNVSFECNLHMLHQSVRLWQEAIESVRNVKGIVFTLIFNPLTVATIRRSIEFGGNSLGLTPDKPLIICAIAATWEQVQDDSQVIKTTKTLFTNIDDEAKRQGVHNSYVYMNYAWEGQKVIDGYGELSKAELKRVSARFDPNGLFQKAVPGGFKLF